MNHQHGCERSPEVAKKALLGPAIDINTLVGGGMPRSTHRLTARELDSLTAVSDTLLPSIDADGATNESLETFYRTSASMAGTPEVLGGRMASGMLKQVDLLWLLRIILWLLSTWFGTFAVCGTKSLSSRFPYFHKFSDVDRRRREEIMVGWSRSPFSLYGQLFRGLKYLITFYHFTQVNEKNESPWWPAMGYCGPDPQQANTEPGPLKVDQQAQHDRPDLGPLHRALVYMESPRETLCANLAGAGLTVTTRPGRPNPTLTIRCDAVVIGSGSGGGLVAGVLATAGYKVVVLEKGGYHARTNLSLVEGPSLDNMYESGGILTSDDTGVLILSGSTVGGGSAVNWAASIRTPDHVVHEWRHKLGLELFGSDAYAEALDAVCSRMGVQYDVGDENLNNAALRRGCKELGYPVRNIPRNAPADHSCGWCCFGCRDGRKQATSETWLVDMANSGNGVILPGCKASKILHTKQGKKNVATGVVFEYQNGWSEETEICIIESKVTVVACGALGTPVLLKKSGLRNPNIGKHLHLHPVVMVWGYFPETENSQFKGKSSYDGGIMTAMSTVASNSTTTGYGTIIQTPALHPGMFSVVTPWVSGEDFKDRMVRFARTAHVFALARDRGEGTVKKSGSIEYKMAAGDEENLKVGVDRVLRILMAAGATEIGTLNNKGDRLDVKNCSWHESERFVKQASGRRLRDWSTPVCSAHQMGSCRMGLHEGESVVNQRGETWEMEGLFVADASVFPTALGVNPMVTVQAIAYCTAQSVLEALKRKTMKKVVRKNKEAMRKMKFDRQ